MVWAVLAMTLMITALDQLFWRPMVVWSQRFRVEESGQQAPMRSWFLERLRRSGLLALVAGLVRRSLAACTRPRPAAAAVMRKEPGHAAKLGSRALFVVMVAAMAFGSWRLVMLLIPVSAGEWWDIGTGGAMTLGRVLLSTAMGTAWAVPAGLAIGLSPRLSRVLQPVVQVIASFPAPMLFPAVVALLHGLGVSLGWGSIALMLLGTQWYILFNVVAGATAIPADLREAARLFHYGRMQRFTSLYLPAVFPYLVTGWVTAAGGAWNASIVAEHVEFRGDTLTTQGLGALVSSAATAARFPQLAASLVAMSAIVVLFNRIVWRRLHALAERRFVTR
jgi:NitT/TauT family transport system permease protein